MAKERKKVKQEKKKKRHTARNTAALAVVLAALAWLGAHFGGLGFGLGTGENGQGDEKQVNATVDAAEQTAGSEQSSDVEPTEESSLPGELTSIKICISDEAISVENRRFTDASSLKEYILSVYEEDMKIELQDSHAVKRTYDSVKQMLDELGYPYTETQ